MKRKLGTLLTMLFLVLALCVNASAASDVAKIGSKKYATLPKAFSAAKSGDTVTLLKNVSIKDNLSLSLGKKKVALNLNKKTLKVSKTLNLKKGSLTITGSGKLQATEIKNAGTLIINKGTITGSVNNTGSLTIKGGTLNYTKGHDYAIKTKAGSVTISGGKINYKAKVNEEIFNDFGGPEVNNGGAIVVDKGKSKVTVNGGKIVSSGLILLSKPGSKSTITLGKGTFEANCLGCFSLLGNDKVTVSGGTYSIHGGWGVFYVFRDTTLQIKDGTFKSDWSLVETYSDTSKATISGGKFTTNMGSEPGQAAMFISFDGKISVTGGTYKVPHKAYALWAYDYNANKTDKNRIKVSSNVKLNTPNLWKDNPDVCG